MCILLSKHNQPVWSHLEATFQNANEITAVEILDGSSDVCLFNRNSSDVLHTH